MSIGLGVTKTYTATDSANSTDTELLVPVVKPANVYRFGVINAHATAIATGGVFQLYHRVLAGSDADRVLLGELSATAAVPQGEGIYMDIDERVEVNPGEELVLEVETIAGSTSAHFFIEVVEYPFVRTSGDEDVDRLANMTKEE
jgi:hypothetical protein